MPILAVARPDSNSQSTSIVYGYGRYGVQRGILET
jgi:hypothetical protein